MYIEIMETMCSPSYHYNGFVAIHVLRHMMYMMHELLQSHSGDSRKGTSFTCLLRPSCFCGV